MPTDLITLLKQEGHDVVDAAEEGLAGHEDPDVLQAATAEARIVLTFDTDFANIRKFPLGSHGGIVVFRLHDQRWHALEGPARRLLSSKDLPNLDQGLAVVTETRTRIRRKEEP